MKRVLGILSCLVLILVCSLALSACGNETGELKLSSSDSEIELVLGTDAQTATVEFVLENYGNGSSQLNFSLEEEAKSVVSLSSESKGNGKTILTVTGLSRGTAKIVATSLQGSQRVVLTVKVVQPITALSQETQFKNKLYVIAGGQLNLSQEQIWKYTPSTTNQRDLCFSFVGESEGVEISEEGILSAGEDCALSSVTVKATSAHNELVSTEFTVQILKPLDVKMFIDDVEIKEDGVSNFVEIFPTELETYQDGNKISNSKEIYVYVFGAGKSNSVAIDVVLGADDKFEALQQAYSYDVETQAHVYTFLLQSKSTSAGKVDWVQFVASYSGLNAGESQYEQKSVKLNVNSYNKPQSVEINGENTEVGIDVFENNFVLADGRLIEFSLLPGEIKNSEKSITIWTDSFSNLPVSLYKLNPTRTGYTCVFGYDQNGDKVDTIKDNTRCLEIETGTKLYAFVNKNYDPSLNKTATLFAQASCFCEFKSGSDQRALTKINFVINPSSKSISLATKKEDVFEISNSKTIFAQVGGTTTCYVAVDPSNFAINSSSFVSVLNESIATVGRLEQDSTDNNYVYAKFTLVANKVGATKVVVTLSDGRTEEFNLEVVSPLKDISIDLENLGQVQSDIIPYSNITDKKITVENGHTHTPLLNKLSIANSGGSGIQLIKTPKPSTAQFYTTYEFADLASLPKDKTLQDVTLGDFKDLTFGNESNIINTSRLKNLSIIEAINSSIEGNVVVKIDVYAMQENGEFTEKAVGSFYYLINFFVPISNLTLTNGTLELNSYSTVGDKLISQAQGSFSVTITPASGGLTPTYVKNLVLETNGEFLTWEEFEKYDNVLFLNKSSKPVSEKDAVIKIVKSFENNTYTFDVTALKGEANFVFAVMLSEIGERKYSSIARVIVKEATEIQEIEVVNASKQDPIVFYNPVQTPQDKKEEYYKGLIEDVMKLELVINITGPSGKTITNPGLEFEFNFGKTENYYVGEDGNRNPYAWVEEDDGKYILKILRGSYVSGEFTAFTCEGTLKIYPTSNYFLTSSGCNGEQPIVEIPVEVKDCYVLNSESDLKLLEKIQDGKFELGADIVATSFETISNFSGTLNGNGKTLTLNKPLFETSSGTIENLVLAFDGKLESEKNYYSALANTNSGTITNVTATVKLDTLSNSSELETSSTQTCYAKYVGAIAGRNTGTISNSNAYGTIYGQNVGAIAGLNEGTISGCVVEDFEIKATQSAGAISAKSTNLIKECSVFNANLTIFVVSSTNNEELALGGLCAISSGKITLSKAEQVTLSCGKITNSNPEGEAISVYAGGLVGIEKGSQSENASVNQCFFEGTIVCSNLSVGGLVGKLGENAKIENCYAKTKFENDGASAGQFINSGELSNVITCYVSSNASFHASSSEESFATNSTQNSYIKTTAEGINVDAYKLPSQKEGFTGKEDFTGWDFESIWKEESDGLPTLINAKEIFKINGADLSFITGDNWIGRKDNETANMTAVLFRKDALSSSLSTDQQSELQGLNTISLVDFIDFGSFDLDNFKITSSNSGIVSVTSDNNLKLLGTGKVTLTVKAKKGTFEKTLTLYVINSLGTINVSETTRLFVNEQNYFEVSTSNTGSLNHETVDFRENSIGFKITPPEGSNITISGVKCEKDLFTNGTICALPTKEDNYTISIYAHLQNNGQYGFTKDDIDAINSLLAGYKKDIKVSVVSRAQRILVSASKAEIDPSSVLEIDYVLESSKTNDNVEVVIKDENKNVVYATKNIVTVKDVESFKVSIEDGDDVVYNKTNNTSTFSVSVSESQITIQISDKTAIDRTQTYTLEIWDSSKQTSKDVTLTVVPQQILSATYVHYNRTDNSTENGLQTQSQPSSVLMPGDCGLLAIALYPTYSNFTKIEIESEIVDGSNFVYLEQMYKSGSFYLPVSSTLGYNSVRDGNKLTIEKPDTFDGNIYVRTKILDSVTEGLYFPLTITIYDGEEVVKKEKITIVSEVIDGARITINGSKNATVARGNTYSVEISVPQNQSLASYTISDYTADESLQDFISLSFNSNEYTIENERKVYEGTITVGLDAEINGDGLVNINTIVNKVINGRLESVSDSIQIGIVDFLIEEIKIKDNADGDNVFNTPVAIEKTLEFEFVFSTTPSAVSADQKTAVERIQNAKQKFLDEFELKQKTVSSDGDYIYEYIINTDKVYTFGTDSTYSTNNKSVAYNLYYADGELTPFVSSKGVVQEDKYFEIKFNDGNVDLSATQLKITAKQVGSRNMQIKIPYRAPGMEEDEYIVYNFVLNAQVYSDEDKPTPIYNEEQFNAYITSSSSQYATSNFILMENIVLENFTPISATGFASLDGNNKIITIKSFAVPTSGAVSLALFNNISTGTVVKNLTVDVGQLETISIASGVSSVNIAGFAVNNYGIVYNCEVVSLNANGGLKVVYETEKEALINATTIAGFVVNNNSQATITNSRFGRRENFVQYLYNDGKIEQKVYDNGKIEVSGKGDVSGFVSQNSGIISASYFANGTITNSTTSSYGKTTSGFVQTNSGEIYASYSEGFKLATDLELFKTGGGIIAQGTSAGFVYKNSGLISDSYANIKLVGEGTGRIVSGFVYENEKTATIERCYSASTVEGSLTIQMPFTGSNEKNESMQKNPSGLTYCYYIVGSNKSIEDYEEIYNTGAKAIDSRNMLESSFYGYAISKDGNSVWSYDSNAKETPELVSANKIAISVRRVIKNYSSLIASGTSIESYDIFPYLSGFEYGKETNPIIIKSADEFNRVFGNEKGLSANAYYEISKRYDKNRGIVFGHYRLVASIDFNKLTIVDTVKISSSVMNLTQGASLDGNGLVLQNVEVALDGQSSVGLFSEISRGSIFKNVTIYVSGVAAKNGVYVGAVAGYVSDSILTNITIKPVTEKGEDRSQISGQNIVGGIAGAIVGNSTISNLTSYVSVVAGYKTNKDVKNFEKTLRNSKTSTGSTIFDENSAYSFAGGIVGVLDIYEQIGSSFIPSSPNAKRLTFTGNEISVQASFVGGIAGYCGANTFMDDAAVILTGSETSLSQRLISYDNTIGGVVGVNYGKLYEIRIEHEDALQEKIENNLENYYASSSSVFRGNTKLFSADTSSGSLKFIGGLVGQMLGGELTVSYSKVDVSSASAKYAGGVVGRNEAETCFFELYAFGDVDAQLVGGLIGQNEANVTFDNCVAINFFSKTNSRFAETLTHELYSGELYEVENGTVKGEKVSETTVIGVGGFIGEHVGKTEITINSDVFVNEEFENFLGKKLLINNFAFQVKKVEKIEDATYAVKTGTDEKGDPTYAYYKQTSSEGVTKGSVSPLSRDLSQYEGYARDAQVINKMFLTAGWDPLCWELKDNRYLPTFNFGVAEKVLYIEKPQDFEKLKTFWKGDNVVIFGDDPTTAFNPYEYKESDPTTYGEFTKAELDGLKVEGKVLTFDISRLDPAYTTYYFQYFRGSMYREKGDWTYKITGLKTALFNSIYGGSISGLTFAECTIGEDAGANGVLANGVDGETEFKDLTFEDITLTAKNSSPTGILAGSLSNVFNISDITITNCTVNGGEKSANVGVFAGEIIFDGARISEINNIKISGCTLNSSSTQDNTNLGLVFGTTRGTYIYNNITINKSSSSVNGKSGENEITAEGSSNFNIGGLVGFAEGTHTVEGSSNFNIGGLVGFAEGTHTVSENCSLKDIEIIAKTTKTKATINAGLVFGHVDTLTPKGKSTGTGTDASGSITIDSELNLDNLNVGGFAGSASSAKIENVKVAPTITISNVAINDGNFASVGGVIGKAIGETTISSVTTASPGITGITVDKIKESEGGASLYIGGVVGLSQSKLEIKDPLLHGTMTSTTNKDKIENAISKQVIGGIVGNLSAADKDGVIANISSATFCSCGEIIVGNSEQSANVANADIGGIVGNATNKGLKKVTISGATQEGTITVAAATATVGGIVGSVTNATITGAKAKGAITIENVSTKLTLGGVAGSATNSTLGGGNNKTTAKNGSDNSVVNNKNTAENEIVIEKADGANITAGGVVGTVSGGTLAFSYAWGNITHENSTATSATFGGIVGEVNNSPKFYQNYSLTTLYITNRTSTTVDEDAHVANALVGKGTVKTKETSGSTTTNYVNFYCHQVNLATDTIGTNLFYCNGTIKISDNESYDPILSYMRKEETQDVWYKDLNGKDLKKGDDDTNKEGRGYSKLWPANFRDYVRDNEKGYNYYATTTDNVYLDDNNNRTEAFSSTVTVGSDSVRQLIVGDGKTLNVSTTPFNVVNGAVSGFKIVLTSSKAGSGSGGRVSENDDESLPNGIATENNGIVYAISVEAKGYAADSSNTNVRNSVFAGLVKENNGLVADCGVVLNVKSAWAGLVATNNAIVKNCYATGAVHEGAEYAFTDSPKSGQTSRIYDCYTAIKIKTKIYNSSTIINSAFDKNAYGDNKQENVTETVGSKTITYVYAMSTSDMSKPSSWKASGLLKYDATNYAINFGYPYFGAGAYEQFEYFKVETREKIETTSTQSLNKDPNQSLIGGGGTGGSSGGSSSSSSTQTDDNYIYLVPNAGKLKEMIIAKDKEGTALNLNLKLLCDMDLPVILDEDDKEIANWTQVTSFSATLDGNGYVVENINLASDATAFVVTNSGTIKNIGLVYKSGSKVTAGVCATNDGTIDKVFSSGATASSGGLVETNKGTISSARNFNNVDGSSDIGGIAATSSKIITDCSNYGNISNGSNSGGIVGKQTAGSVFGCYNYGAVSATANAGGIVGVASSYNRELAGNTEKLTFKVQKNESGGYVNAQYLIKDGKAVTGETKYKEATEKATINLLSVEFDYEIVYCYFDATRKFTVFFGESGVTFDSEGKAFDSKGSAYSKTTRWTGVAEVWNAPNDGKDHSRDENYWDGCYSDTISKTISGETRNFRYTFYARFQDQNVIGSGDNRYYIDYQIFIKEEVSDATHTVSKSMNLGNVIGNYAGGIVGRMMDGYTSKEDSEGNVLANVSYSKNTGIVAGTKFAGGIVGGAYPNGGYTFGTVYRCTNEGLIGATAASNAGCEAQIANDIVSITDCYGAGALAGTGTTFNDGRNGNDDWDRTSFLPAGDVWSYSSKFDLKSIETIVDENGNVTAYNIYTAKELTYILWNMPVTYSWQDITKKSQESGGGNAQAASTYYNFSDDDSDDKKFRMHLDAGDGYSLTVYMRENKNSSYKELEKFSDYSSWDNNKSESFTYNGVSYKVTKTGSGPSLQKSVASGNTINLMNDIDLSKYAWRPINVSGSLTLNLNGYTIYGLGKSTYQYNSTCPIFADGVDVNVITGVGKVLASAGGVEYKEMVVGAQLSFTGTVSDANNALFGEVDKPMSATQNGYTVTLTATVSIKYKLVSLTVKKGETEIFTNESLNEEGFINGNKRIELTTRIVTVSDVLYNITPVWEFELIDYSGYYVITSSKITINVSSLETLTN